MKTYAWLCCGMSAGAALMYVFDPNSGKRRRSLLKDKAAHSRRLLREAALATAADTSNRARGLLASCVSFFSPQEQIEDDVLEGRVRSRLGRVVSHPSWIRVEADHGRVKVAGHVPRRDKDRLHRTVVSIRGVEDVDENDLVVDPDEGVPYTEAELRRSRGHWPPAERLGAALAGLTLGTYGMSRGGFLGGLAALAGLGLVLRGLTNVRLVEMPSEAARQVAARVP